jgi:soluble lytic murein transglycosylase-like protein
MLLAGAAFVSPNALKQPPPKVSMQPVGLSREAPSLEETGRVTTIETFKLAPKPDFEDLIAEASERHGVPRALIRAVIRTESAFDPLAVSSAGAQGLMQIMPALAKDLGVKDAFDPRQNIMAGTQYLKALLGDQKGNLPLALASYNAGPGNVERYKGIPPFKETQRYVKKIMDLVEDAEEE